MATVFDTDAVQAQVENLQDAMDNVKEVLAALIHGRDTTLSGYMASSDLDPIGKAKLFVTLAYTIDSLLFCYMKANGTSTERHTIMDELLRIKQYVVKIKQATANQNRKLVVDKAAASRIVGHATTENAASLDRERATHAQRTNQAIKDTLVDATAANIGKHTRFSNSGIMQDATERIVAGAGQQQHGHENVNQHDGDNKEEEQQDILRVEKGGEGVESGIEEPQLQSSSSSSKRPLPMESMFEESKAERKNRERRERKVAKKTRQRKLKVKQAERE